MDVKQMRFCKAQIIDFCFSLSAIRYAIQMTEHPVIKT